MMTSGKADRKALPAPTQRLRLANTEYLAPEGELQEALAAILSELLQTDNLSRRDDFFNALGANSLILAQFCTRIREQLGISDLSMKDLYQHASIEKLALLLEQGARYNEPVRRIDDNAIASDVNYYGCAVLQLLMMFSYSAVIVGIFMSTSQWAHLAETPMTLVGRALAPAPARVLTMSSGGMYTQPLKVGGLQMSDERYQVAKQYALAKRAQVVLNAMWADRVPRKEVVFHALHPGWVDTPGITEALPGFSRMLSPLGLLRKADMGQTP